MSWVFFGVFFPSSRESAGVQARVHQDLDKSERAAGSPKISLSSWGWLHFLGKTLGLNYEKWRFQPEIVVSYK